MTKRRGLGRGLEQLIPPGAPSLEGPEGGAPTREILISEIAPNPLQPRTHFDASELEALAQSIREYGVLQPLVVERDGIAFRLVAGERRLRASQLAGLETVPVVIRPVGPERARLEMALVENLQRSDISPLDEARAFTRLCDEFGLTQDGVARQLGRSRSGVANTMRLLSATPEVQRALEQDQISAAHARALLAVADPALQAKTLLHVVARHLSVRETERLVARLANRRQPAARPERPAAGPEIKALETALARRLSTRVRITPGARGRGRVVIEYFSTDELNGICETLGVEL
ncbi:MAG: ParB/RepB/Spo0J family partition protein [Candidatus Dormiibacterota bacterium]